MPEPTTDNMVRVAFPVSDELCADILCTAYESGHLGIGYWGDATPTRDGDDALAPLYYRALTIVDAEGEETWEHTIDYDGVRRGIAAVMAPGFKVSPSIRGYIATGVAENDAGNIDADCADVIVQAACFGEIVYG